MFGFHVNIFHATRTPDWPLSSPVQGLPKDHSHCFLASKVLTCAVVFLFFFLLFFSPPSPSTPPFFFWLLLGLFCVFGSGCLPVWWVFTESKSDSFKLASGGRDSMYTMFLFCTWIECDWKLAFGVVVVLFVLFFLVCLVVAFVGCFFWPCLLSKFPIYPFASQWVLQHVVP